MKTPTRFNSRVIVLIIIALFFVPYIVAHFLYRYAANFHFKKTNHGQLILPPVDMNAVIFSKASKSMTLPQAVPHRWLLVSYRDACCTTVACISEQRLIHQIIKLLNNDMKRVGAVLLEPRQCSRDALAKINADYIHTDHITFTDAQKQQWLAKMPSYWREQHNELYIVDPIGNLMMGYMGGDTFGEQFANDVLADIKQLLKVSQIG